jgi:O-acetylhomoserine (thiol)-lyase
MGGVVVESGRFDWTNGRFPRMTEPVPSYGGLRFWDNFAEYGFCTQLRVEQLRDFGTCLAPLNAFLLLQGLETLSLRMEAHVTNALGLAQHLAAHPAVAWVSYAGLADSPYHGLAQRYMPRGPGAVFSFGIKGGRGSGQTFVESVELASHLANIGDTRTLVIHPASTTHRQLSDEALETAGVRPDLIRVSVGIEDLDDIIWDFERALDVATKGNT